MFPVIIYVAFVLRHAQVCCLYSGYSPRSLISHSVIDPKKYREQIPCNQYRICIGQHLLTDRDVVQCDNENPTEAHHYSITVPS